MLNNNLLWNRQLYMYILHYLGGWPPVTDVKKKNMKIIVYSIFH